jgi:hypothetical protein
LFKIGQNSAAQIFIRLHLSCAAEQLAS